MLARTRLLTLTGPGGTGKTRLGLRVADDVKDAFEEGVCFVPLAPITDPGRVADTIAQMLGVRGMSGIPIHERLISFLQDKHGLVVLDNFEQVVEAAPLVADLLAACPKLKILVTSRASLHVQGEHEFPVPPLAVPDAQNLPSFERLGQYEAVALFVQRACAVRPAFALSQENASSVAEICIRLDGLPLAIELAAARIKVLSPRAILARLQHRFDLLTGGACDLPPRHRTLREAIAWSYDLLTKDEKRLFRRLAVFVGGHPFEAAERVGRAVAGGELGVLDGLTSLVDKNLLGQKEQPDGEPRFFMLETIREFGLECLIASGEEALVRQAHRDFFLDLAEAAEPQLTGPQQSHWLARLKLEHDNLRAALDFARGPAAARLAAALWRFWLVHGHLNEGSQRLDEILADPSAPPRVRVKLLTGAGTMAHNQGRYRAARALYEQSLVLFRKQDDKQGIARALNNLGWAAWRLGDYDAAWALSEESLTLHRKLDNKRGIALALNNLGWVAQYQGEYARARSYFEDTLALQRELNDTRGIAFALNNLGWTLSWQGRFTQATTLLEEALTLFQEVGDRQLTAFTLGRLGLVVYELGELERAVALLEEESLPLFRTIGDTWGIAFVSSGLGRVMQERGDLERAIRLYEDGLALWQESEDKWGIAESLGRIAGGRRQQQNLDEATTRYRESLRLRQEMADKGGIVECLEGLAHVAWDQRRSARAARLFGAAAALREAIGSPLPPRCRASYQHSITTLRTQLGEEAFATAWDEGQTMTLAQAVAFTLKENDTI